MTASNFTWAGKRLTPKDVEDRLRTSPMPLVVKVTHVTSDYEKSCPYMANGTVLWVYGSDHQERVALKKTDNTKYISMPLEAPFKFQVVYTQDRGPPILLSSILRGKAQSDLRVEMAGNIGNRLSSTPDKTDAVRYETLQVLGIYKETVLQSQSIVSISEGLDPIRRNISVNCPVTMDIATGLYGKSPDEFRKLKDRLKQDQSTKTTNQPDTSGDIALLAGTPKSLKDVHMLSHTCRLYSAASVQTSAADAVGTSIQPSSTVFEAAVARLTAKVGSDICKPQGRPRDSFLPSMSSGLKLAPKVETHMSCYHVETGSPEAQMVYVNDEGKSKQIEVIYEDMLVQAVGFRDATAQGRGDVGNPLPKSTMLGRLKDGVYVKDWKHKEAEKLAKLTVPAASAVPSSSAVPLPPVVPSPRAVPFSPELDEDYEGDYEEPVEKDNSITRSKPHKLFESARKKEPTNILSPSDKPPTARNLNRRSVFSGLKNKIVNFLPKKESLKAAKSTTSLRQGVSPEEEDGGETYDTLDYYDKPEEDFRQPEVKEKKNEDSDVEENYEYPEPVYKWKTLSEVPKCIKTFSISDVSLCLQLLNFRKYVQPFRERNVDGAFLRKLNKKNLMQMFQMQEFEAKQLVTFAKENWRPKT